MSKINQILRITILSIFKTDQKVRQLVMDNSGFKPLVPLIYEIDQINQPLLKEIIKQYGWPGFDLVGKQASHAFWLLTQHADSDLIFQKYCLDLLTKQTKIGNAYLKDVAYLTDRILLSEGKKQSFGTHYEAKNGKLVPQISSNPQTLKQRRRNFGLPSIEQQTKKINRECAKFLKDNPSGQKNI